MQTDTPALRAAIHEKHRAWSALLVPLVIERLDGRSDEKLRVQAEAIIVSAFGCLDVAVAAWTRADNAMPLADYLDMAFDALRR